jgi:hypothetical protein
MSGELVSDFEEYTFRAPRPGFFLGDSRMPKGTDYNPIAAFALSENVPSSPLSSPYLGQLDRLPVELLHIVIANIDSCTAVSFRSINEHAKAIVDSVKCF